MTGLSTTISISLGWTFVAGRKRVPRPAAGKTAVRTEADMGSILSQVESTRARPCTVQRSLRHGSRNAAETRQQLRRGAAGFGIARVGAPASAARSRRAEAGTERRGQRGGQGEEAGA